MHWRLDHDATQAAQGLFEGLRPEVRTNGVQYIVEPTPYGRIELVPVGNRYLVAAESPPGPPEFNPVLLTAGLRAHLKDNCLQPWRVVKGRRIQDALLQLTHAGPPSVADTCQVTWSPYARPLCPAGDLVGEDRESLAVRLRALVASQRAGCPLTMIAGPYGVGKHQVASVSARLLDEEAVELPLGRMFTKRMLSTGQELLLDTLLTATPHLSGGASLLVISDSEFLCGLSGDDYRQVMLEIGRIPHTILLATSDRANDLTPCPGMVSLPCPGLRDEVEVRQLLAVECPELEFADPVAGTLCRAASVPRFGIVPGRLLYMARLARALRHAPEGTEEALFSDDATAAATIVRQAWLEHPCRPNGTFRSGEGPFP